MLFTAAKLKTSNVPEAHVRSYRFGRLSETHSQPQSPCNATVQPSHRHLHRCIQLLLHRCPAMWLLRHTAEWQSMRHESTETHNNPQLKGMYSGDLCKNVMTADLDLVDSQRVKSCIQCHSHEGQGQTFAPWYSAWCDIAEQWTKEESVLPHTWVEDKVCEVVALTAGHGLPADVPRQG